MNKVQSSINKLKAKELGNLYYTGLPCKSCGASLRLCCNSKCVSCNSRSTKEWRKTNSVRYKTQTAEYRQNNLELCRKRVSVYRNNNPDKCRLQQKRWRLNNPDKRAAKEAKRRANKLQATPTWINSSDLLTIYEAASYLTRLTGISWEVDHEVPLKNNVVCGLHVYDNLQLLPSVENIKKSNKFEPVFTSFS
jgi:hypothetical protein